MKDSKYKHTHKEHDCCPDEYDDILDITGNFQMDAVIAINKNSDLAHRLAIYCKGDSYGPGTGYNSYSGYSKDN